MSKATAQAESVTGDQESIAPPTPPEAGTERFDDLIQIVRPWMKVALAASVVTILGALTWSIFATISTSVSGTAAILPDTGFEEVASPIPGMLSNVFYRGGDHVDANEIVAKVVGDDGRQLAVKAPVAGTVEIALFNAGAIVKSGDTILLVVPDGAKPTITTYLTIGQGQGVEVGQPVVITSSLCPAYTGAVSSVLRAPLTRGQIADRVSLQGLAHAISPPDGGIGISVNLPADWCPDAAFGSTGQLVVTTGTVRPISYLRP